MKPELTIRVFKAESQYIGQWSAGGLDSQEFSADSALDAARCALEDFRGKSMRTRGRGRGRPTRLEKVAGDLARGVQKVGKHA